MKIYAAIKENSGKWNYSSNNEILLILNGFQFNKNIAESLEIGKLF